MKQTQRKNNTNRDLTLPSTTSYFTIRDLVKINSGLITASEGDITIRVKLTKEIEKGRVVELGSCTGGKGRPPKVFAVTPVTQTVLNKAKADNITLVDNADRLVNAITVSSSPSAVSVTSPGVPASV